MVGRSSSSPSWIKTKKISEETPKTWKHTLEELHLVLKKAKVLKQAVRINKKWVKTFPQI